MSNGQIKKQRLGDLLVSAKLITEQQLETALLTQKELGERLGNVLLGLGYIEEVDIQRTISEQLKMPFIEDLTRWNFKAEVSQKIPEEIARMHQLILLEEFDSGFLVGMSDPTELAAHDKLRRIFKKPIIIAVLKKSDVMDAINQVYHSSAEIDSFAKALKEELSQSALEVSNQEEMAAESAPVAKLLDSIFENAVQLKASDIHIEPAENFIRIRQRVDGVLQESIVHGKEIISALVLRIKLIANLDISEKRLPQDGRFYMNVKSHSMDVRLSTMPVRYGESVVMRILDQSSGLLRLNQIGLTDVHLEKMLYLLSRPSGVVLVTGPTGSGKTTTLYASLSELNSKEKKIITIEDPVEYSLPRANQVQVNTTIGLTFASVLRSALRQDPDIVMVGEIRDEETAEIALRAAMTGHTVLSTLHTNDAISTPMRLVDMGAEPFLVASALRAVMAQRLIRKLCTYCLTEDSPSKQESEWLNKILQVDLSTINFKKGKGCQKCHQTGYNGRMGVYELLEMTSDLAECLRKNDTAGFMKTARAQPGYLPLAHAALEKAKQGQSSLQEVLRISSEAASSNE